MIKEALHIIIPMDRNVFVQAGTFTGLTIRQADSLLINMAVDELIALGYPQAIEHEIIYLESYVVWPQQVVYLCIHQQE